MKMRYEAIITGDVPPLKWQVRCYRGATSQILDDSSYDSRAGQRTSNSYEGQAASREEALFAAAEAARLYEAERTYTAAVETVPLFEVDTKAPAEDPDAVLGEN